MTATAVSLICTASYLPAAMVTLESFRSFCSDGFDFHILLTETRGDNTPALPDWITVHTIEDLTPLCPRWRHMAYYYTPMELNCALRPFMMQHLFGLGYGQAFHCDTDLLFTSRPSEALAGLQTADVLLIPHLTEMQPDDGLTPGVAECLRAGQFNMGFYGFRNTPTARDMLAWWARQLEDRCLFDESFHYFVDQFWAAHFISFTDHACILRHPGYNVAYWNIHQRPIDRVDGQWRTGDERLVFFHFSGYRASDAFRLSHNSQRFVSIPQGHPLHELVSEYRRKLADADRQYTVAGQRYSFSVHADGSPVSAAQRRAFLALTPGQRAQWPDPFTAGATMGLPAQAELTWLEAYLRRTWNYLGVAGAGGQPKRIALFGAGKHTARLASIVKGCAPAPRVVAILDEGPARHLPEWDLHTIPPQALDLQSVDEIVLSTDTLIDLFTRRCRETLGPDVPLFNLYDGFPLRKGLST